MSGKIKNKFPFDFRPLDPEEEATLKEKYDVYFEFRRVGPKGYIFSADYEDDAANIYNMQMKPDDVIVFSYPRSGTTWTQELVWLLVKDLDYESARATPLSQRYTFIEFPALLTKKAIDTIVASNKSNGSEVNVENFYEFMKPSSEILASSKSPRFIKTHLPLSFLPPTTIDTAKCVHVARDPRDVAVSFYHQNKLLKFLYFKGDFKAYWDLFKKNLIFWTPYFENVKEAWALRHHPNMLFLFYEELSKNLPATLRRVADFFGKQLSEEQLAKLCDHLSIENFKKNDSVNYNDLESLGVMTSHGSFIRKGKAGGWRDYFDEEMSEEAERWIEDNLRDTDLRFPHLQ